MQKRSIRESSRKINPRENMKLSIRKSEFQQNAEKIKKTLQIKGNKK